MIVLDLVSEEEPGLASEEEEPGLASGEEGLAPGEGGLVSEEVETELASVEVDPRYSVQKHSS